MADRSGLLQLGFVGLAIWLITADPVERLLPVPMPELIAGADTTRIAEVMVQDGVPDYATVLDVRDHQRLTSPRNLLGPIAAAVGTARWSPAERVTVEPWLLGRKPLVPAPILYEPKAAEAPTKETEEEMRKALETTPDRAAWLAACAPGLEALQLLPDTGELALPLSLCSGASDSGLHAGDRLVMALLNLGDASLVNAQNAAHRGDLDGLAAAAGLTSRIADWVVDSQYPKGFTAALNLEARLRKIWLAALVDPSDIATRRAVAGWSAELPAYDPRPALGERSRIRAVLLTAQRCAAFRSKSPPSDTAKVIRRNAPPDPNIALAEVHLFCDASDRVLGGLSDITALAAIDPQALPPATAIIEEAFDRRPMAERLLFRPPVAERRAFVARRFAALAVLELSRSQRQAVSRARNLVQRHAAVRVALAVLDHHARTGSLPTNPGELPAPLQRVFAPGVITLSCADGTCTIVTAGDKAVTLWRFPPHPAATPP